MKKRETKIDPRGNEIDTIHLNYFGYQMWFQSNNFMQFCKNARLASRIDRKARRAKNQLLEIQKLVNAINDEYHS